MPKVSTAQLSLNGQRKKFEVHYSSKRQSFFVKLPAEITSIVDDDPHEENEAEAARRGQEILKKFEAAQSARRKAIVVHVPTSRRGWTMNGVRLDLVGFQMAAKILDEVTIPGGTPMFFDPRQGRAVHVPSDEFAVIQWTAEREQFFTALAERMESAEKSLLDFVQRCAATPELCSFEQMPSIITTAQITDGNGIIPK